ncbi:type II toxin-antitoxin system RelE/ParE family toxin [Candidatus Micrarchaeota archaeon]|nr:type II toxin-antitoxin system RelE/ParE family toxin [Candidatus Micrarchaeota archaeon]
MFKVVYSEESLYQLKKLDNNTAKRIIEKINETQKNPIHFFKRLAGREEYKLRVGDYRIIADIMQKEKTVFIRSLGHRKKIYK